MTWRPRQTLRALLFDWDGTLVDSAELSYRCYVRVFESFGIRFGRDDYERTYSPDWRRTYRAVGLPPENWPESDALWLRLYGQESAPLLPGAAELLDRLRGLPLSLGIVSSGEGQRVRSELAGFGLTPRFDAIVCGGETPNRKPHPEPLLTALEQLGVAAARAAYVGDSPEDVTMARAAGVFTIGIPGAFPNREALRASAPELLLEDLRQIAEWASESVREQQPPAAGGREA